MTKSRPTANQNLNLLVINIFPAPLLTCQCQGPLSAVSLPPSPSLPGQQQRSAFPPPCVSLLMLVLSPQSTRDCCCCQCQHVSTPRVNIVGGESTVNTELTRHRPPGRESQHEVDRRSRPAPHRLRVGGSPVLEVNQSLSQEAV